MNAGSHGGNHVEVEGSFDNWSTRQVLQRTGKDFNIVKLLPPGVYQVRVPTCDGSSRDATLLPRLSCSRSPACTRSHCAVRRAAQYKFIVDGEWKYDPNQPAMFDGMGNVNNVIEVHEYVPENLDSLSGFEPPPSPVARFGARFISQRCVCARQHASLFISAVCLRPRRRVSALSACVCARSYSCPPMVAEDYAKEPHMLPPHLQLTLLNVPPAIDAHAVLPRPQHVILSHLYCQRGQVSRRRWCVWSAGVAVGNADPGLPHSAAGALASACGVGAERQRAGGGHDAPVQVQVHHHSHLQTKGAAATARRLMKLSDEALLVSPLCFFSPTCHCKRPRDFTSGLHERMTKEWRKHTDHWVAALRLVVRGWPFHVWIWRQRLVVFVLGERVILRAPWVEERGRRRRGAVVRYLAAAAAVVVRVPFPAAAATIAGGGRRLRRRGRVGRRRDTGLRGWGRRRGRDGFCWGRRAGVPRW